MNVRSIEPQDHAACVAVVKTLTDWFTPDAQDRAVPADLKYQQGFLAESEGRVLGFVTLFVAEGRLNIGWLAVRRDCHRQGIGGKLLARAAHRAAELGLSELATYTLGDSVEYEPYETTRSFYFKHGFQIYQRNKTDNPECPEEYKIRKRIAEPAGAGDALQRA